MAQARKKKAAKARSRTKGAAATGRKKVAVAKGRSPERLMDVAQLLAAKLGESGVSLDSLLQAAATVAKADTPPVETAGAAKVARAPKGSAPAKNGPTKRVSTTVPLNWKEVWFTNCPMVSANNVDQELGWCREEFKKIGVEYAYFRHAPENNWYPHYIHNLDNLIRFGGLYPPIHVHADLRRTRLLGATWVYEGGCMAVRARDPFFRMKDLKGKKIGISKSLNTIKNDWWRIQEHMGITNMLMLNDMTMGDIELVEFPYPDDWYDKPEMLVPPMNNPSELWMRRNHKHDLAFRPLETALLNGAVDAIYTQSKPFQHLQEATGQIKMIEDLSKYPDWTIQVANTPAVITCTEEMAEQHPELVIAYMKAMIKVGRWANDHKRAASVILNRQTFYLDADDTYEGIKHVDMVPSLNALNLQCIDIGKDFMLSHGYIKNDFDVSEWAAPEFLEKAATELLEEQWELKSWSKLPKGGGLNAEGTRLG